MALRAWAVGQGRGAVLSLPSRVLPSTPSHRLQTGWSVHTFQTEKQRKMQALSPKELEVILGVIRKAEQLDAVEQQRIGYGHVPCPLPSKGQHRQEWLSQLPELSLHHSEHPLGQ